MPEVPQDNPAITKADVLKRVKEYVDHLESIARVFNEYSLELGLGVLLDPTSAI